MIIHCMGGNMKGNENDLKRFPWITKEGGYFSIGTRDGANNRVLLSNKEIKILCMKLKNINIDKFFWKEIK